jgi:outer membrane protein TolC
MKRIAAIVLTTSISMALATVSSASTEELKPTPITLQQYLEVVRQNNAVIGSAALDVQNASANKVSQSLYQLNPSVSYARGNYHNQRAYASEGSPVSSTYGLSFTVEGWGKRGARENLAQAQTNASLIQLEQTKSNIELSAIFTYIDTLRISLIIKSLREASAKLKSLSANMKVTDAQRFIEHQIANMGEDLTFTALNLLNFSGGAIQGHPAPNGSLDFTAHDYKVEELVANGQSQRMEILSLQSSIEVADKNMTLTKKNRNINVYPYISQTRIPQYQYNSGVSYTLPAIGPLPAQNIANASTTYNAANTINAGITIPIPITNYLQNADIVSAANQKLAYEMQLKDLKEQIRVQVLQASLQYRASVRRLERAQEEHRDKVKNPNKNPALAVMDLRDSEGALLDAKTNHLKALITLWRQSGNYSVPTL